MRKISCQLISDLIRFSAPQFRAIKKRGAVPRFSLAINRNRYPPTTSKRAWKKRRLSGS
jgi:hypothetical protein